MLAEQVHPPRGARYIKRFLRKALAKGLDCGIVWVHA
jgi:hypothetical protein